MKCAVCGTEFEGKFCPNCGTEAGQQKTCPKCGAALPGGAKFCTECGYSFSVEEPPKPTAKKNSGIWTAYRVFASLPGILMALFTVLAFAFMAAPVTKAVSIFGFGFDFGNVYNVLSLKEEPSLRNPAIAFLVFACVEIPFAIGAAVTAAKGKGSTFCTVVGFLFYLAHLIISACMMGAISKLDDELGVLSPGGAPILMMVFPIVFAFLSVWALVICKSMRNNPAWKKAQAEHARESAEEKAARKKAFYETHKEPVLPQNATKQQKIAYKQQKYCYDHARETAPRALVWLNCNKGKIVAIAFFLALVILLASTIVPAASNRFRIKVVQKIELGASEMAVEKVLGEPDDDDSQIWRWYDKKLRSYMKRAENISQQEETAFMKGDFAKVESLESQYEELENEMQSRTFSCIEVTFTDSKVASVFLDKAYVYEADGNVAEKTIQTIEAVYSGDKSDITKYTNDEYYISYLHSAEGEKVYFENSVDGEKTVCITQFTDGSYYCSRAQSPTVRGGKLFWSDRFGEHSAPLTQGATSGYSIKVATIDENGVWKRTSALSAKDITIPDGVTSIGEEAFSGCTSLTSITMPDSVTSIGEKAFSGCISLTGIAIPDSVTSIGEEAFSGCTSLTGIAIPDSVTSIGKNAFSDCASLTSVTLENGAVIAEGMFSDCTALTDVSIERGAIAKGAFSDCASLTNVTLGEGVTAIGDGVFSGCSITSIVIPDSVTSIGNYAFSGCAALAKVTIGSGVKEIGESAFSACISLTAITYKGAITQWHDIQKPDSSWDYRTAEYTITCTDGTITKSNA